MKNTASLCRWCVRGGLVCCLAIFAAGAARAGAVAHWSFDGPDPDGNYPDSVNNGHPAAPADKAAVKVYSGAAPAPFGNAVSLLGPSTPNSYLTIPPLTNILTTPLTVAAWVNLTSPNSAFVLADWPSMSESAYAFGFHPFGANKSTAQPNANLTSIEPVGGRGTNATNRRSIVDQKLPDKFVPLNTWHHIAWVWDKDSGTLTSYLDGQVMGETKRAANAANLSRSLDIAPNGRRVRIGSQELSVGQGPANLTGAIDELWVFDEMLTLVQIRNLIKANDIAGVVTPATTATAPVVGGTGGPTATVPEKPPTVDPTPAIPETRRTTRPIAQGTRRETSPARIAGILTCLAVIVTMSCYLVWAFVERAKLRSSGNFR